MHSSDQLFLGLNGIRRSFILL